MASTVPGEVQIIATTARPHRRMTALGGRVQLQNVTDGGRGIVGRAVRSGRAVVTVPPSVVVQPGWWESVGALSARSGSVGVYISGDQALFSFPAGIGSTSAARVEWNTVRGLARSVPVEHRVPQSLGAVLIVKDEEEVLQQCLDALTGMVDQVVVYDTGSTDATTEIARASGAVVVDGIWDGDFGAARNRALEHCTTDWVLSVDADERVASESERLRLWIDAAHAAGATMAMVEQISTSWDGAETGLDVRVTRLFHRASARWDGAIHEMLVPVEGSSYRVSPHLAPVKLMHSGYRVAQAEGKAKGERNAAIALSAVTKSTPGSPAWVTATSHYGRSLALAHRLDEALAVLGDLLDLVVPPNELVPAARTALSVLLSRPDEPALRTRAERWISAAESAGEAEGQVALWRASLCMAGGDWWGAADRLAGFDTVDADGGEDIWGAPFDIIQTVTAMATVDLQLGLPGPALQKMQSVLHAAPDRVKVVPLVEAVLGAGCSLTDLIREAPGAFLERSLRDVPQEAPSMALEWFTAMADEDPGDFRSVVAASIAASRTGVPQALEWSVRAREAGLEGVCALRMLAENADLPEKARLLAWAVLLHGFGELDAGTGVLSLSQTVSSTEREAVLTDLRLIAPGAVDLYHPEPTGDAVVVP